MSKTMDIEARRVALRATLDLAGLDESSIDALAADAEVRTFAAGDTISADDQRSIALYVVVTGLVAVSSRSEHRRAPVESVLGPGGLFGEDLVAGAGMMGAVAYRASTLLVVPGERLRAAIRLHPALGRVAHRLALIQHEAPWIVDHLRRSPLLGHVPPAGIYPLLEGAELIEDGPGEIVFEPDQPIDGMVLVLAGEVHMHVVADGPKPRPLALGAGAVFGEDGLLSPQPLRYRVEAGCDGCRLLVLRASTFRRQAILSASFRRAILASGHLDPEASVSVVTPAHLDPEVLRSNWTALVGDRPGLPLSHMTEWLAAAAHAEWGDRVLVVHLDAAAPVEPDFRSLAEDEGVVRVRLRPDHRPQDPRLVRAAFRADMVFIDFGDIDPMRELPLLRRINRTVFVATDPYRPIEDRLLNELNRPLVYTAVVPSTPARPGEERVVPRGTVRIHRDLVSAARRGTPLDALPGDLRCQLSRWMRAVTERRVGVALGGGGALGFAHLAVFQEIERQGLPVDLVAGVSGGAVIGAFYAAGQQLPLDPAGPVPVGLEPWPGLARFVNRGAAFNRACHPGIVTGGPIADWVDGELHGVLLEDLLVPFFPVATDIDRAVQVSIRAGPIGFGVRASGSLPGPFTPTTFSRDEFAHWRPLPWQVGRAVPTPEPTTRAQVRYVDGGVLNNIPDDALYLEGAQAVIASNVVPAPQPRAQVDDASSSRIRSVYGLGRGRVPRFLREFDPVLRADDALRSGYMMMHSPADWRARTADARYHARTAGYSFLDWDKGDAIRLQALDDERREHLEDAVYQLKKRYQGMRSGRTAYAGIADGFAALVDQAADSVRATW